MTSDYERGYEQARDDAAKKAESHDHKHPLAKDKVESSDATGIAEAILSPTIGKVRPEVYTNMVETVSSKLEELSCQCQVLRDLNMTLNQADRIKLQRIHDLELRPKEIAQVIERHRDEHKFRAEHAAGALRDMERIKAECCEVLLIDIATLDKKA